MYYVYQITNKINGKIYVGVHKTDNPNDSYMGSGIAIRRAIAAHGADNFTKEMLFVFESEKDAYAKEAEIVTADFVARADTYNMTVGGIGGFSHIDNRGDKNPMRNPETAKTISEMAKARIRANPEKYKGVAIRNISAYNNSDCDKSHSPETRAKIGAGLRKHYETNASKVKGRKLTDKQKANISAGWSEEQRNAARERQLKRIAENTDCVRTNLGKKLSDETKSKMADAKREAWKKQKQDIATCPYCGKTGVRVNMKRWHFDRCKHKPEVTL